MPSPIARIIAETAGCEPLARGVPDRPWHSSEGIDMARIAVGGFQHETNTFAPQRATWADFERADAWPGFIRGPELEGAVKGYNLPIAGAVQALRSKGTELVPFGWW